MPDNHTIVIDKESTLKHVMKPAGDAQKAWQPAWRNVSTQPVSLYVDMGWFREIAADGLRNSERQPEVAPFAPLWKLPRTLAAGIDWTNKLSFDMFADCDSEVAAKRTSETLKALLTLTKNHVDQAAEQVAQIPDKQQGEIMGFGVDLASKALDNAKIEVSGKRIVAQSTVDYPLGDVMPKISTVLQKQRETAQRMQNINNLKQIGLAFHNYLAANNHFPPAVVMGPDGKTPHSWRVELLPYLDQQALFESYKMDEPWDGPNNIKLSKKIPAVYGGSDSDSAKGCFVYVFKGPKSIFESEAGCQIQDVTDGTSNTILAFEMPMDTPWTKPDDIEFDPEKPLPPLKGGTARRIQRAVRGRVGQVHQGYHRPTSSQVADHPQRRRGGQLERILILAGSIPWRAGLGDLLWRLPARSLFVFVVGKCRTQPCPSIQIAS